MSVAISPDGQTLATDMQGSIWTVPAAGGAMKRITDVFNDARQPRWSPDGRTIVFFAYRDGGYDIWAINPDGSNQRKLTWGTFDDREPIYSHDGTRIAFSSDRGNALGSDYNIWTLDLRNGELKQITKGPSEDFMPSWSANDDEIAYASSRDNYDSIWTMNVRSMGERRARTVKGARLDAPSFGPRRPVAVSRDRRPADPLRDRGQTGDRKRERVRVPRLVGIADRIPICVGREDPAAIGLRPADADHRVHRDHAGDPSAIQAARPRLHVDHPAQDAWPGSARALARRHADRVCSGGRHLRDAGRWWRAGQSHQATSRSIPIRRGRPTAARWFTRRTRTATCCSSGSAT